MNSYKIFIVEDDEWYGRILEYHLSLNPDYEIKRFLNGKDCLKNLHLQPDLITIDYSLPDMSGAELFEKIKQTNPDLSVIAISAQEDISTAVDLLKKGITDYLVKDDATKDQLWNSILRIRENQMLKLEVSQLKEELSKKYNIEHEIIGQSPAIKSVLKLIEKAITTNVNVFITGETGTGKEVVAKTIHYNSTRKKKKIVAINMAAIPKELIESELFGHEKGAFTGALTRKIGKFEEANEGTLFLDEIAELELGLQSKILRVLQEREFTRVGGNEAIPLNIRLIVATHKNILQEVQKGSFREDLYYRIIGLPIELPPLKERGNDILLLAKHFIDQFAKENNLGEFNLMEDAKEKLMQHAYPGNIRELKSIIELATVFCESQKICASDIRFGNTPDFGTQPVSGSKTLKEHNIEIIRHYLEQNDHDVVAAAHQLDIGKSTIYKMIKSGEL